MKKKGLEKNLEESKKLTDKIKDVTTHNNREISNHLLKGYVNFVGVYREMIDSINGEKVEAKMKPKNKKLLIYSLLLLLIPLVFYGLITKPNS